MPELDPDDIDALVEQEIAEHEAVSFEEGCSFSSSSPEDVDDHIEAIDHGKFPGTGEFVNDFDFIPDLC